MAVEPQPESYSDNKLQITLGVMGAFQTEVTDKCGCSLLFTPVGPRENLSS